MSQATLELTEDLLSKFRWIIEQRTPVEACGVLLPTPHLGHRIWEMPNRSPKGHQSFTMLSEDVRIALMDWINANPAHLTEVAFWHTHPSGDSTPSKPDLDNRVLQACNLVLAIDEQGNVQFSWY